MGPVRIRPCACSRAASGRVVAGLVLLALFAGAGPLSAGASAKPYDLLVMVVAPGPGPTRVAISYPAPIDHGALAAGINQLAQRARVTPSQLIIRDAPLAKQLRARGTDAQFQAAGLVPGNGYLPVGAIIRSLPQWEHMRLVFVLDPGYPFVGPSDVTVEQFAVRLVNRMATYEYDVERIRERKPATSPPVGSSVSSGDQLRPEPGSPRAARAALPRSFGRQVLPAVLVATPSGLLIAWLLHGWRERARRARRAGQQRPAPDRLRGRSRASPDGPN